VSARPGPPDARLALLRRAAAARPSDHAAAFDLATALMNAGLPDQAIFHLDRARTLDPTNIQYRGEYTRALLAAGQWKLALPELERLAIEAPDLPPVWTNLSFALLSAGRLGDAERACRRGLDLDPDSPTAAGNLANLLCQMARAPEGLRIIDEFLTRHSGDDYAHSARAFVSNYAEDLSPQAVRAAHESLARARAVALSAQGLAPAKRAPAAPRRPGTPIRVGIVSPDFHDHPVATFLLAFLREHDRAALHLSLYHTGDRTDHVTAALRALAPAWVQAATTSDGDLAQRIARDRIDVLIDLAGNTAANRLGLFALRPAPVQVTAIGYPSTTGEPAIDFRLVDSITDPPAHDGHITERPLRIDPCFLCYTPPLATHPDTPPVSPAPILTSGTPTFASFNNVAKLSRRCVGLWAQVLSRVPGSRLLLKAQRLSDPGVSAAVNALLADAGIDPARVELLPPTATTREHLASYARVDIARDTFPYNGTTTTCEALFMGVPVVAMLGDRHAARVSASLLTAANQPDLVANSPERFVDIAVALAADAPALARRRESLRCALLASPLCDARSYARRLGEALRAIVDAPSKDPNP
jgi:predicted O-linked N-acetylglucosamine transferase (SPINDLY family)